MDIDIRLTAGPPKLQSLVEESKACNQRLLQCYEYHVTTVVKPLIVLKDILSPEFYPSALVCIFFFYSQRFRSRCKSLNAIQHSKYFKRNFDFQEFLWFRE